MGIILSSQLLRQRVEEEEQDSMQVVPIRFREEVGDVEEEVSDMEHPL
jgi:hypothetical protein